MATLNDCQREDLREERSLSIYKRDDMIQSARYRLTVQEQRAVLYSISKVKPEDDERTEYSYELKDFYKVCGITKDTYTSTKRMLKALSDKSWWIKKDGKESLIRWFNTIDCDPNSGKVVFKFHERIMPYLVKLVEQGEFYTSYNLKYILPMSSKHSPRLYEILKSYQKNNNMWFFEIDTLKYMMDCENYVRWPDFRRYALDPAVEEINKYTDICITYDAKKEGRKVTKIMFYMDEKTDNEKLNVENEIQVALDGQLHLLSDIEDIQNSNMLSFMKERGAARRGE